MVAKLKRNKREMKISWLLEVLTIFVGAKQREEVETLGFEILISLCWIDLCFQFPSLSYD